MRNLPLKGFIKKSPIKHSVTKATTYGTGVNKKTGRTQVYHTHETPEGTIEHTMNENRLVKGKNRANKKDFTVKTK